MDHRAAAADFYRSDLAEQVSHNGNVFPAFLDQSDRVEWETVRASTHSLRYLDTQKLATSDLLTIAADTYKVIGLPTRINGSEYQAELVKQ